MTKQAGAQDLPIFITLSPDSGTCDACGKPSEQLVHNLLRRPSDPSEVVDTVALCTLCSPTFFTAYDGTLFMSQAEVNLYNDIEARYAAKTRVTAGYTGERCACGKNATFNTADGPKCQTDYETWWYATKKEAWTPDGSDITPTARALMTLMDQHVDKSDLEGSFSRDADFVKALKEAIVLAGLDKKVTAEDQLCLEDYNYHAVNAALNQLGHHAASKTANADIELARRVVERHQHEGGLDVQTANAIMTVWNALSVEQRAKFEAMSLTQKANVAWKLVSKSSAKTAMRYKAEIEFWADQDETAANAIREAADTIVNKTTPYPDYVDESGIATGDVKAEWEAVVGGGGEYTAKTAGKKVCEDCGYEVRSDELPDFENACPSCGGSIIEKKEAFTDEPWIQTQEEIDELHNNLDAAIATDAKLLAHHKNADKACPNCGSEDITTSDSNPDVKWCAKCGELLPDYKNFAAPKNPVESHREEGRPEPSTRKVVADMEDETTVELGEALDAFDADEGWFDGSADSIYDRINTAKALRKRVTAALSDNAWTTASINFLAEKEVEMGEEIAALEASAAELTNADQEEYLASLPGGTVAQDYGDLIEGGLVDLGEDDGSWLYAAASKVQKEAKGYDWDAFATEHAEQWVNEKVHDSPGMLAHERVTREAAVDYARNKTMVLFDMEKRAGVINTFVNNVEKFRRHAALEVEETETRKRAKAWRGTKLEEETVQILEEHPEVLWW